MVIWQVTEAHKYSFINAKLKARKSHLLTVIDYELLLNTSINEGLTFLNTKQRYHDLFTDLNISSVDFLLKSEKILYSSVYSELYDLLKYLPKETTSFIRIYLSKPFIRGIKFLLRQLHGHQNEKETLKEIFVTSSNEKEELKLISQAKTIESLIDSLTTSWIQSALKKSLPEYYKYKNILLLENALDYHYYKHLWNNEILLLKGTDKLIVKKVIGIEIDLFNLSVILRSKILNSSIEEILANMIPIHYKLNSLGIRAASAISFSEAMTILETSVYSELIQSVNRTYQEKKSIYNLDLLIQQYFIQTIFSLMAGNPFHIGMFLFYLVLRLQEVENLRIIFHAKWNNLDLNNARELMIYFK